MISKIQSDPFQLGYYIFIFKNVFPSVRKSVGSWVRHSGIPSVRQSVIHWNLQSFSELSPGSALVYFIQTSTISFFLLLYKWLFIWNTLHIKNEKIYGKNLIHVVLATCVPGAGIQCATKIVLTQKYISRYFFFTTYSQLATEPAVLPTALR